MTTQNQWSELNLEPIIQKVIANEFKFQYLMPVQKAAIPHFIKNYDVAVEAQTGSGKTLTFLVPLFNQFSKQKYSDHQLFGLVLSPARELAQQIYDVAKKFQNVNQAKIAFAIGGTSNEHDVKYLNEKGCNILIATPGKLRQLLDMADLQINVKTLEFLIFDEADRLMSNEYSDDIRFILSKLPKQRRTGLFSATLSSAKIHDLMKLGLRNPVQIKVNANEAMPAKLRNYYHIFENRMDKIAGLVDLIEKKCQNNKSIIFFNTCCSVVYYSIIFKQLFPNCNILSMNGQMAQKKRQKIVTNFKSTNSVILFTTDVLARGLDFDDVPLVIQFDPPQDPSFFIHRSGRTARQGRDGEAILLLEQHERGFIQFLGRSNIEMNQLDGVLLECQFQQLREKCLKIVTTDRDIIEKGKAAFISFIRSYKEHKLQILFQFNQLNIGKVAYSFFLLRIPRIKEILSKKIEFEQSQIDPNSIPFLDKNQEKQYLQKRENKDKKLEEKKIQQLPKQQVPKKQEKNIKNIKSIRKKVKQQHEQEDDEELRAEQNLVKKLKQGKITLQQFKEEMKNFDPEDLQDADYDKDDL
ncbi:unnamed protein product [Paramecium octaurelia]|uniref:ATP-dependent RNA helicase n=1 Tax=Paramecium octaurelia TaxID=43137 RepID=A0A8S1UPI8_PAROT|nr:unnamed protein product [Paramecium octaurelia]